ncbi:MAG: HflK protein [Lysobacterales bacterium]|jgi:membrane protease subunit HflK|nr:MAG: HflK protein [Xanthomonadales bacterium]
MAWNKPGKGRSDDPWSDGGRGSPDVEDFLRRVRAGVGRLRGGGEGGGRSGEGMRGFFGLILLLLALWVLFDSWHMIDARQKGVVLRFGQFNRIMSEGLNFAWPRPIERVRKVDVTTVRAHTSQSRVLTRDENIVIVDYNVQYRVADPVLFLFGARNPEDVLKQAAESAVRGVIGTSPMEVVLSGQRAELISQAREITQAALDLYQTGLRVTDFSLQNARPPAEVREAFDDAISAREDRQRIENEARAYASKIIPEARGQAARVLQEAEAYREAKIARAQGEVARFLELLEEYRKAPEITRRRLFLETMEQVLAANPKVLVDDREGRHLLYLPIDRLGGPSRGATGQVIERLPPTTVLAPPEESPARTLGREASRSPRGGRP